MTANPSGSSTPFEWLSGGLFFGKKAGTPSEIDTCKDVSVLLSGVHGYVLQLPVVEDTSTMGAVPTDLHQNEELLAAARLRRLRFLLYDERRQTSTSQANNNNNNTIKPAVASKMSELLTGGGGRNNEKQLGDLMPSLVTNLGLLPFEMRKDASAIFAYLLLCGLDGADASGYERAMSDFRDYVERFFDRIMPSLIRNHDPDNPNNVPDVVLHSGLMFRACTKHLSLYELLVSRTENVELYVYPFLDKFVHSPKFDCASDAMDSLKLILTGGAEKEGDADRQASRYQLAATFLDRDYQGIWEERFNAKLLSSKQQSNYLIRRMALQILSTVLLTRANYKIMVRYISNKNNLILVMLLLRDKSPHITLDAFHAFKIFVANPNKPPEIIKILSDNKQKLTTYIDGLHKERETNDSQFRDEKALVISTLQVL